MKNIEHRIKEANGRLRNYGISIEQIGARLYLRATLPPKPQSIKNGCHQQRITIAIANVDGLKLAEKEAKSLSLRLDAKTFDWNDYLKPESQNKPKNIGDWIQEFEKDYFQRKERTFKTESTWKVEYQTVFKVLPGEEILNPEILKQAILTTKPDTRTRKRFCLTLRLLAKFADLDFNPSSYSGNYNHKSRQIRSLPPDKLILECHSNLGDNVKWQWVFGMLATYGLRNHEVFFLDLEQLRSGNKIISVLQGKTGYRRIWPYHPEWFDQFGLQNVKIPDINCDRNNSAIGGTVSQRFRRNEGLPFKVYDLRHCWAIRTLEYGIDISLAAQQMGHSLQVHSNLYHTWTADQHHQRAFDLAMNKSDRPRPPES